MAASRFTPKLGSLSRPPPPFPAAFSKTLLEKKTCAYQSPSRFQRAASCLNCPSLHTDHPGTARKVHFGGALCPSSPRAHPCCRCSALGIRCHFPAGTECPARPPAGEHCQGLLFLVRTWKSHSSPHCHTPGRSRAEERRMYCMRRLLR